MTCFHPNKRFLIGGVNPDTGKPLGIVTSSKVKWIRFDGDRWIRYEDGEPFGDYRIDFQYIPCQQCIGCRMDYSAQWAARCMLEAQYYDESWFVTLTYDDDHLPWSNYIKDIDMDTGEVFEARAPTPTLRMDDFSAFMKRLRKNTGQDLRVYPVGEYGSKTFRPHYHAIIFGLHLEPDQVHVLKQNYRGDYLYRSDMIEKCWKFGISSVGEVSWDTCAYVARYIMKKLKGEASWVYDYFNLEKPQSRPSRRKGIGLQYFEDHVEDIYKYDKIIMSTKDGGRTIKPPRYYDRLYDLNYPSDFARIKQDRVFVAEQRQKEVLARTDLSYEDYLKVQERTFTDRLGKFIKERSNLDETYSSKSKAR